jgi:hypothetical protein
MKMKQISERQETLERLRRRYAGRGKELTPGLGFATRKLIHTGGAAWPGAPERAWGLRYHS